MYAAEFNYSQSHVATKFKFKPPTSHECIEEIQVVDSFATAKLHAFGYAVGAIRVITYVMEEAGIQCVLLMQFGCDNATTLAYTADAGDVQHINAKMKWIKCCRDASLLSSSLKYESLTPDSTSDVSAVVDLATEHFQMTQQLFA